MFGIHLSPPVSKISDADVERIVRRDFAPHEASTVLEALSEYGRQEWHRDAPRVRVAILKLADGNLSRLRSAVKTSIRDARDVLSHAEHPRYVAEISEAETDPKKIAMVTESDSGQYRAWLER